MKRILSLFLAIIIITISIPVFAAPSQHELYKNAAKILNNLGILKGTRSGNLMLDEYLKRQNLVVLISLLYGEEKLARKFPVKDTFKDIQNSHYAPYIYWALSKGLIQGTGQDTFGYDSYATVEQLQRVLLRALDYGSEITSQDIVPSLAGGLKIMEGLDADPDDCVTRGLAAAMILNALKCQVKGASYTLAEKLNLTIPSN